MEVQHPKSLVSVSVHTSAPSRKFLFFAVVGVLYALVFHELYVTMGEPLKEAEHQANELSIKKLQELALEQCVGDDCVKEEVDGEEADDEAEVSGFVEADWIEEVEAFNGSVAEKRDWDERPLPSGYLPSALSCAGLLLTCSLHALFYFMCMWSTAFKSFALFGPASEVDEGCFLQMVPGAHRGKAQMVQVFRSQRTGRLTFEFQRQKYEYFAPHELRRLKANSQAKEQEDDVVGSDENGAVRLIGCPVDLQLSAYIGTNGLKTPEDVSSRHEHFGQVRSRCLWLPYAGGIQDGRRILVCV